MKPKKYKNIINLQVLYFKLKRVLTFDDLEKIVHIIFFESYLALT